jgi:hypothetical protein
MDLVYVPPTRLLKTFTGCSNDMFQMRLLTDEFDSQATLDANWNWKNDGRFPPPSLSTGSLVFGPHNLDPMQWWNNWTPLASLASFGDVLYCVRYRVTPPSSLKSGDNTFETSVRGDSGGMSLVMDPIGSAMILHTRLSDSTFVEHGRQPLAFKLDTEQTVEVVLWAHGNHYYVEGKNVDTGEVEALAVDYPKLPAQSFVGMLAWRLKNPLFVDRAVVGLPGTQASQILAGK